MTFDSTPDMAAPLRFSAESEPVEEPREHPD
jgi:hypothetical protein